MKKTTAKVTKALTPAKKPAKSVRKTAAPVAPASPVVSKSAEPVAPKPVVTTISATYDVGFGNALFVRGEGAGLSWEKGRAMECVADTQWTLELGESSRPIVFKFLINDETWSTGDDFVVEPGASVTLAPSF